MRRPCRTRAGVGTACAVFIDGKRHISLLKFSPSGGRDASCRLRRLLRSSSLNLDSSDVQTTTRPKSVVDAVALTADTAGSRRICVQRDGDQRGSPFVWGARRGHVHVSARNADDLSKLSMLGGSEPPSAGHDSSSSDAMRLSLDSALDNDNGTPVPHANVRHSEDPPAQWTTPARARECARSCSWPDGSAGSSVVSSRRRQFD
jgi:hypothetical protein